MKETLKEIFKIIKQAEASISELKADHSFEKPIQADLVKTQQAMAYENILSVVKKFARMQKEQG